MLKKRGFTRLSARPRHPKTDEAAQEAFKACPREGGGKLCRDSRRRTAGRCGRQAHRGLVPEPALAKAGDEARVGQQGTLTRLWGANVYLRRSGDFHIVKALISRCESAESDKRSLTRGSRPRAVCDNRYQWAYIFGAVCPRRGVGAALVMPYADTEAMNAHLAEISRCVAEGAHAVLVLD